MLARVGKHGMQKMPGCTNPDVETVREYWPRCFKLLRPEGLKEDKKKPDTRSQKETKNEGVEPLVRHSDKHLDTSLRQR